MKRNKNNIKSKGLKLVNWYCDTFGVNLSFYQKIYLYFIAKKELKLAKDKYKLIKKVTERENKA